MGHILDYDGKFINFLNKATDTLIATLLCLVCSIPIITIGASTTAYYSVMLKTCKKMRNPILQKVSLRLLKKTSKLPLLSG